MITIKKNDNVFNYRVAGVAIYNEKVLIHKGVNWDFWALPGGRCEFLETSNETLIREMNEEIGVEITIIRLLYLVENFFNLKGKRYHELSLYYLMEFPPDFKLVFENDIFYGKERVFDFEKSKFNGKEFKFIFKWVEIDKIETIRLHPVFLHKSLKNIKPFPEHILQRDY